ncbi:MAG TPA: helix-turn-helix domain-containing protein [Pseudolysinimonas sp.]|jgi:AcrR family transcriptional regulator|nr:helix-turn-helix domain-containing protein [Pseudolysinimonas sp.]
MRADTLRNRAALIDAARRVFEVEGIDAPLENVAAAAGLSRTSLHRAFSSRGELLAAIWASDVAETEADAARFADHPDAFVRLFDATLQQQVDRRSIHPNAAQIESPDIVALAARFVDAVQSSAQVSRRAGVLRADVSDDLAVRSLGMAIWAVWNVADRAERTRVAREVGEVLLRGLLA